MAEIKAEQIVAFLDELGRHYTQSANLILLGGSALCLLGSERATGDIDYVGDDLQKSTFQQVIEQVAHELVLEVEAVPIEQFVPIPPDSHERQIHFGRFGAIEIYILDPYVIALSKVDRGFVTDINDIVFLIRRKLITFEQLASVCETALHRRLEFDLSPQIMRKHLQDVKQRLE